jgi:hypothetical protein
MSDLGSFLNWSARFSVLVAFQGLMRELNRIYDRNYVMNFAGSQCLSPRLFALSLDEIRAFFTVLYTDADLHHALVANNFQVNEPVANHAWDLFLETMSSGIYSNIFPYFN